MLLLLISVFDELLVAAEPESEPLVDAVPLAPNVLSEEVLVDAGVLLVELAVL